MNIAMNEETRKILQRIRKGLLDTTTRNRLISFKHPKTSSLRIIDESPNILFEKMLNGKVLEFEHIPKPTKEQLRDAGYITFDPDTGKEIIQEPDAKQWAEYLGINTSYSLPTSLHDHQSTTRRKKIQTLLYPEELEIRLRNIRKKANQALEEKGTNILYLCFGFLEWGETSPHEDKSHCAPLLMLPVSLSREPKNHMYEYKLSYSDEDIIKNVSLAEKVKDFNLELPEIPSTLNLEDYPEKYWDEIQDIIENNPITKNDRRWRVERYITLALPSFRKLWMYLDLDPVKWENTSLPKLFKVFLDTSNADSSAADNLFGDTHTNQNFNIDTVKKRDEKFTVLDADGSQHNALLHALNGKNIVVIGPPGTGKSQTIANLIALAIEQGKNILFVADKLAALQVVQKRLENIGLGNLCLELHSNTTKKSIFYENLKKRYDEYERPDPATKKILTKIKHLESIEKKLTKYVAFMNSPWNNTGHTPHAIYSKVARNLLESNLELGEIAEKNFTRLNFEFPKDTIEDFKNAYETIVSDISISNPDLNTSDFGFHPWCGVKNKEIAENKIVQSLQEWQNSLNNFETYRNHISDQLRCDFEATPNSIKRFDLLLKEIQSLPDIHSNKFLMFLPRLDKQTILDVELYIKTHKSIQKDYENLQKYLNHEIFSNLEQINKMKEFNHFFDEMKKLVKISVKKFSTAELEGEIKKLTKFESHLQSLTLYLSRIQSNIGEEHAHFFSLSKKGIRELKIFISIISSIESDLFKMADERFENKKLDMLLPKLKELIGLSNELDRNFYLDEIPNPQDIKKIKASLYLYKFFRVLRKEWRVAKKEFLNFSRSKKINFSKLSNQLNMLIDFATKREEELVKNSSHYENSLGEYFMGLKTDIESLEKIRNWYKEIQNEYRPVLENRIVIAQFIKEMSFELFEYFYHLHHNNDIVKDLDILEEYIEYIYNAFNIDQFSTDNDLLLCEHSRAGIVSQILDIFKDALANYGHLIQDRDLAVHDLVTKLTELKDKIDKWNEINISTTMKEQLCLKIGPNLDQSEILTAISDTLGIAKHLRKLETTIIVSEIYRAPTIATFQKIKSLESELENLITSEMNCFSDFENSAQLELGKWLNENNFQLQNIIFRNNLALSHVGLLKNWNKFIDTQTKIKELEFDQLIDLLKDGRIQTSQIYQASNAILYVALVNKIQKEEPWLKKYTAESNEKDVTQFRKYDVELQNLRKHQILHKTKKRPIPAGNNSPRVKEKTELSLVKHEIGKQTRHIHIRQLISRASDALINLKPCLLMSPVSVAQYLPPGKINFDLIIMDEASQLKPEDSLGTIARGKSLAIAGDPNQLPPNNLFERIGEDNNSTQDDESDLEGSSRSILDVATLRPDDFSQYQLLWHYRSKHEDLIKFSNYSFYDNKLIIFPTPTPGSAELGIKYRRIENGAFINRRNHNEALAITSEVENHFKNYPKKSLGIVAMNISQQEEIENAIEARAREDSAFQELLNEAYDNPKEPLFIKNLENAQGDERDVIFISMTYGPGEDGKVAQRFGPINRENGWKRLNVLFTRAKEEMHIFSSMDSKDITISPSSSRGVIVLHDFLEFVENKYKLPSAELSSPEEDTNSDFQIAVMQELEKAGFECKTQIGAANFFIDIGICDPKNPGHYLMGIESDGPSYYSAKSVRERNRLRPETLERLGWRIRRIWSIDFFKNPKRTLSGIIDELTELTKN